MCFSKEILSKVFKRGTDLAEAANASIDMTKYAWLVNNRMYRMCTSWVLMLIEPSDTSFERSYLVQTNQNAIPKNYVDFGLMFLPLLPVIDQGNCKYFNNRQWMALNLFENNSQVSDAAYDFILSRLMRHGAQVALMNNDYLAIEQWKDNAIKEVQDKQLKILKDKTSPTWKQDAMEYVQQINKICAEANKKLHPIVKLIPSGMKNVEELGIWLDLNG